MNAPSSLVNAQSACFDARAVVVAGLARTGPVVALEGPHRQGADPVRLREGEDPLGVLERRQLGLLRVVVDARA